MKIIAFFLASLLLGPPVLAQQQDISQLTAKEVVDKALAVFKQNEELVYDITSYKERRVVEDFAVEDFLSNQESKPRSKEETTSTGQKQSKIIVNGQEINVPKILSSLYQYRIPIDLENRVRDYNGIECFVVEFESKAGLRILETKDNFTHRLRGQIFINTEDMNIVAVVATIPNEFIFTTWKFIFPVRIKIRAFSLVFSQKYELGLAFKNSVIAVAHYEVWGAAKGVKRFTFEYFDYKLRKDRLRKDL